MAGFHTASKWLKLSLFLAHLCLLLLFFPLATVTSMATAPLAAMIMTCVFLLGACVLTFCWVYVMEVRHNRLFHLITMSMDFIVVILAIITVIILFEFGDRIRNDNVIEATIATAVLTFLAAIFTILDMKRTKVGVVEPTGNTAVQEVLAKNIENNVRSQIIDVKNGPLDDALKAEGDVEEERFPKVPMWLKGAFYFMSVALVLTFMPVEPYMHGGTREVTALTYLCVMAAVVLLFSWVFVRAARMYKSVHVTAEVFVILTGIFSLVTAVLWLTSATATHPFTPVFYFGVSILSTLAAVSVVLEMKQFKLQTQRGYCDRVCTAQCFNAYIRVFNVQGISVLLEEENAVNGVLVDRYGEKADPPVMLSATPDVKDAAIPTVSQADVTSLKPIHVTDEGAIHND